MQSVHRPLPEQPAQGKAGDTDRATGGDKSKGRELPRIFFAGEAALGENEREHGTMRAALLSGIHEAARISGASAVYFNSAPNLHEFPPIYKAGAAGTDEWRW
jgi:hypothetical protein